jgi:bacterioferritin
MHEKSIDLLNEGLADELSAIYQYMYFHFHCDDQGYDPLANMFKRTAIDEMLHSERLAERILFLGGEVEMVPNAQVDKIHNVEQMLAKSKEMEEAAVKMYTRLSVKAVENGDVVSKKLFEDLAAEEEGHYDGFDTQQEHVKKFGERYLALQSMERSRSQVDPNAGE